MTKPIAQRPLLLITGAGGGMGAACARVLARRYRLVLTELRVEPLDATSRLLKDDGADIVGEVAGDISSGDTIAAIADIIDREGGLDALVHTAGISPSMAPWEKVLTVNLSATLNLLAMVEPRLNPGSAAVLIASLAAQNFPGTPEIDTLLKKVTPANAVTSLEPLVRSVAVSDDPLHLSGAAYGASKYAIMRLCQQRAPDWGALGGRITSISPGLIATPMGLMEAASNPSASGLAEQAPAGRWGTALDIADAAEFLLSDAASFISGSDIRVDGGLTAKLKG